jgi:DNA-binding transcriptional regulator YhcF (GntR family)
VDPVKWRSGTDRRRRFVRAAEGRPAGAHNRDRALARTSVRSGPTAALSLDGHLLPDLVCGQGNLADTFTVKTLSVQSFNPLCQLDMTYWKTMTTGDPLDQLVLDRASPIPLYFQVASHLEQAIESGRLGPGTRFDNEVDLADQLGLSRPTMRRAMQHLVDKGLLVRRRGIGTRVVSAKVRRSLELTSLHDDLYGEVGRIPARSSFL